MKRSGGDKRKRQKRFNDRNKHEGHPERRRNPHRVQESEDRRGPRRMPSVRFESFIEARIPAGRLRELARLSSENMRTLVAPGVTPARAAVLQGVSEAPNVQAVITEKPPVAGTKPLFQPSRSYLPTAEKSGKNAPPKPKSGKKEEGAPQHNFKLSESVAETPKVTKTAGGLHLDAWQAEALEALLRGANLIVDAPTSAGKTRCIEAYLDLKLKNERQETKLVYTTPVKSLSNDKYREFCERYGKENIGINTGDFKENLGAPIVIATLETYRNSLLGVEPNLNRRIVVYDEYHYLQDEGRGSAWEESIVLTPKHSQLVLLSASVPNTDEFADWISKLSSKETKVIQVTHRPVPLVNVVHTEAGWILAEHLKLTEEELSSLKRANRQLAALKKRRRRERNNFQHLHQPMHDALNMGLGPIVVYAGRRADVEGVAHSFARTLRADYVGAEADKMRERIRELQGWEYVPHDLQRLVMRYGVAYHHSGMIPPGRVAIETLLKEGLLRVCAGTMGISLGVNFAVRSAIISDESRPGEMGEVKYSNSEILQMLGRAGRRGRDLQGFSLWLDLGRYAEQRPRAREACRSSLKFDPTTVLGILGQHENLAYLSEFYNKSFFMRGKNSNEVLFADHDLLFAKLYERGHDHVPCHDIPSTFESYKGARDKTKELCSQCPVRGDCHPLNEIARASTLHSIVSHLRKVKAIDGPVPTFFGQLARHFPQAGGLIVASAIAQQRFTEENFEDYVQLMATFCAAHFKQIPDTFADLGFLMSAKIPKLIETFYPERLFPELYDEERGGFKCFREYNMGAASIVKAWIYHEMEWDELVREHSSRHFSAGDCMMVLFRFATFLQSCARLGDYAPEIAEKARGLIRIVLREPLDARNRMLAEETEEFDTSETETGDPENVEPNEPAELH